MLEKSSSFVLFFFGTSQVTRKSHTFAVKLLIYEFVNLALGYLPPFKASLALNLALFFGWKVSVVLFHKNQIFVLVYRLCLRLINLSFNLFIICIQE